MAIVLMPLPRMDFDPTEAAVSWLVLTQAGHAVRFATPDGRPGQADPIMLSGRGLDPWGFVPLLRNFMLLGRLLRANADARNAYRRMEASQEFQHPTGWADIQSDQYNAILLPGGHRARGMREYLESKELNQVVLHFFNHNEPVAAICHGVLLVARTVDPSTGRSVLYGRKTTALTWRLERAGTLAGRLGRFWDPNYYRTYREQPGQPAGYMSVQQEVTRALKRASDFEDVPATSPHYRIQASGTRRDSPTDSAPAFVVRDANYLSARWPGDVFTFARAFADMLHGNDALTA
jgi:putative intracellular protease/amidase